MSRVKLSMPSPAMVVACLALVAALGGTAYAAFLPKNSVKSKSIAPKAVKTSDLANGAVTGEKLKAGAVGAGALTDGSVGNGKIADGAITSGKLAAQAVRLESLGVDVHSFYQDAPLPDDGTRTSVVAQCPAGTSAVGGGSSYSLSSGTTTPQSFTDYRILQSRPNIEPANPSGFPNNNSGFNSWRVSAVNEPGGGTGANGVITAMVLCLTNEG